MASAMLCDEGISHMVTLLSWSTTWQWPI